MVPSSPQPFTPSRLVLQGTLSSNAAAQRRELVGARNAVVHERAGQELAALGVVDAPARRAPGPTPCAMPPWIWPSTMAWLMMRPMSSSSRGARARPRRYRGRSRPRRPARHSATKASTASAVADTRTMPCRLPRGQVGKADRASVPAMLKRPSWNSMSAAAASSASAASSFPRTMHLAARGHHRRAADERRARAHAADAVRAVGIALHDADFFDRDLQHLGDQLHVAGLEALPHRLRAGEHGHRAVGVDLDVHRLGRQRAGPLQVDVDSRGRAACPRCCDSASRACEALPVGAFKHLRRGCCAKLPLS